MPAMSWVLEACASTTGLLKMHESLQSITTSGHSQNQALIFAFMFCNHQKIVGQ
jgi:hypothetical protein